MTLVRAVARSGEEDGTPQRSSTGGVRGVAEHAAQVLLPALWLLYLSHGVAERRQCGFAEGRPIPLAGLRVRLRRLPEPRIGQWWTDQARAVLDSGVADVWLGGHFELVSIGVVGGARGSGTGVALLRALLGGLTHERFLLMTTSDETDPARRLYAREGWRVVGPGIGDRTVIMGRQNGVRRRATTRPGHRST